MFDLYNSMGNNFFSNFTVGSDYLIISADDVHVTGNAKLLYVLAVIVLLVSLFIGYAMFFALCSKTYESLNKMDKVYWNSVFVKCTYCTIGILGAIYLKCYDMVGPQSISSKTVFSYMLVLGHLGFFVYECFLQIYFDVKLKSFSMDMQLHHLMSLLLYFLCAFYDLNHYFCCFAFILEMVAPLNCIRWTLKKAGKKHTFLWKASNIVYIHLFHVRSIVECIILYEMIKYRDEMIKAPLVQLVYQIFCLVIFIFYLTPYWTHFVTKEYYKQIIIAESEGITNKKD